MASVWLARDRRHDRLVAIKVLHPSLAGAIGVDRFLREIRVTARLQHPAIVPVLDPGAIESPDGPTLPWYAMAYVAGESLRARLDRERHLPVAEALRITEGAAAALAAAHREGIVHRDIKPENLLLAGDRVYVADFGLAKAVLETGGERLTSTGLALGTPIYMSPEQAAAQPVDARSDQYSLAGVLYEMLAGEPPFTGPTAQAVVAGRLAETPRPVRTVRPSVPPEGDLPRARAAFEAAERLTTEIETVNALAGLGLVAARAGATQEAREILRRADSLAAAYVPVPLHTAVHLAEARAALGESGPAMAWLRLYSPAPDLHFQLHLRCDTSLDPISADPDFRALLRMPRIPEGCI